MNNNLELKNKIEKVIMETFQSLISPSGENTAVTKDEEIQIIYPYTYKQDKTKDKIRISEQELKQAFISHLQNDKDICFSVETPTVNKYRFKDIEVPIVDHRNQSALVDLSIYPKEDANKPCAHIEFKCGNPGKKEFQKDILKLYQEPIKMGFFVLILPSYDSGTFKNISEKLLSDIKDLQSDNHEVYVYILSLKNQKYYKSDKDLKLMSVEEMSEALVKSLTECK